jgi:hypothetical protein
MIQLWARGLFYIPFLVSLEGSHYIYLSNLMHLMSASCGVHDAESMINPRHLLASRYICWLPLRQLTYRTFVILHTLYPVYFTNAHPHCLYTCLRHVVLTSGHEYDNRGRRMTA